MSQLDFAGTLRLDPDRVADQDCVPAGSTTIPYATSPAPKRVAVSTGDMQASVASPSAFVALPGVGGAGPVQEGTFLFLRTNCAMSIRTTTYNLAGNVLAVEVINGLKVIEPDPSAYLVLLEAMGTGIVEYLVAGPA